MAGRASIVGAAATHVGKVREHNEDAHFFDADRGIFVVCDGMGGHAAGEVASELAIRTVRAAWSSEEMRSLAETMAESSTPALKRELLARVRAGAAAAHDAIIAAAAADTAKSGMGTTLVGAIVVGNELVFAQAGDSRAYLVRDKIAMQLTEDHTLLARLLAAGIDVDVSGEGARFRSMLTNALGIGEECKITTFVVPLADGDRFLLCSDGISEYVPEAEVGTVLTTQPSPARAAQKLIELALERGGGDNATAVVVRVLEAGERPQPAELVKRDEAAIAGSPMWGRRMSPQMRLRALRIAIPRDFAPGEQVPAYFLAGRVAWVIVDGELELGFERLRPGSALYPESLVGGGPLPDREGLATAITEVRALALRADDVREVCEDDIELGEVFMEALAQLMDQRRGGVPPRSDTIVDRGETASGLIEPPPPVGPPLPISIEADTVRVRLAREHSMTDTLPPPIVAAAAPRSSAPGPHVIARRATPPAGVPGVSARAATPVAGMPITPPKAPKAPKAPTPGGGVPALRGLAGTSTPPAGVPAVRPPVAPRPLTPPVGFPTAPVGFPTVPSQPRPPVARTATPAAGIPALKPSPSTSPPRAATPPGGLPRIAAPLAAPVAKPPTVTIPPSRTQPLPRPLTEPEIEIIRESKPGMARDATTEAEPVEPSEPEPPKRAKRVSEGWE